MTAKEKMKEKKPSSSTEDVEENGPATENEEEVSSATKGGKHSHMNDPHPPKHSSEDIAEDDPVGAARKGGQRSHSGGKDKE